MRKWEGFANVETCLAQLEGSAHRHQDRSGSCYHNHDSQKSSKVGQGDYDDLDISNLCALRLPPSCADESPAVSL